MVNYQDRTLDSVFAALADSTRRHVLATLAGGSRGITELASAHEMSLPGFMKHLQVLENAGLIARAKEGRVVNCALSARPMKEAARWMAHYEKFWHKKLDALAQYLDRQQEEPWTSPKSAPAPRSVSRAASTPRRKKSGKPGPTRKR